MNFSFAAITLELLEGFAYTLLIFASTLICALPLGLVIAAGSNSRFKILHSIVRGFVWVIRGTPLILQLLVLQFTPWALSEAFGWNFYLRGTPSLLLVTVIGFSINYACYFSEIYRGGIQSIPKGQYEAAQVLGMSKSQTFFKVILLQVIKRIIPPMSNEIITLVKDTALSHVIISVDLYTVAEHLVILKSTLFPLFYAGVFYLIFNGILTIVLAKVEKRLDYFKV